MADVEDFSTTDFSAKAWVNATCSIRPGEEPLERYLGELEMRLQLAAEDVEAGLTDRSQAALQLIPSAVHDVLRAQGDVVGLKAKVGVTLQQLDAARRLAAASVAGLAEIDAVKQRMEAAASTLKEATELSDLFNRIHTIFASGDLNRISETLASMRRSISLVQDVPEFRDSQARLQARGPSAGKRDFRTPRLGPVAVGFLC
ncbi:hypothetical protein WJX84_005766 [Apatococcus fuscideae]|uniref:Conserved oligomeric Golgi complex subunit 7 n=1 Tax=Apatococcus fuscideae TaxID=2026836 RepID=A0AAW1T7K6_9CHLO